MINFYRSYISSFSSLAKPLLELLKKNTNYTWSVQCEHSFQTLKSKLAEFPILRYPDFSKPFSVHTDASGFALGSQLCQEFSDGIHPIAYHSRVLNEAEKRYSMYEREGLAIVDACKRFRHFILGHETTIITDHAPLKWLMTCDHKSSRLAKFSLKLQEYNLKIIYKPGKSNTVPDALSRVELPDSCAIGMTTAYLAVSKADLLTFKKHQLEDSLLQTLIELINTGRQPSIDLTPTQQRHITSQRENYFLHDDILYYCPMDSVRPLLCVPEKLQFDLLQTYHSGLFGCHVGQNRTYKRLSKKYFWLGMSKSVQEFIASCVPCNQRKRPFVNPVYPLQPIECERPFSRISMDILGPLPLTERGNKYVIAFQCSFTKLVIARPIPNKTSEVVANELIEYVILPHGTPNVLLSDGGSEFCSELMSKLAEILKIDKRTCTPYMASTDGQVERFFSTFSNLMSTVINRSQTDWDLLAKYVVHSYNNSEHSSTGFTPTYLTYGRELDIPFDLCVPVSMPKTYCEDKTVTEVMTDSLAKAWVMARDNIEGAQTNYKYYHDLQTKGHQYAIGDTVYVLVPRVAPGQVKKFTRQYHGPYIITQLRGLNTYLRALGTAGSPIGVEFITHLQRLK